LRLSQWVNDENGKILAMKHENQSVKNWEKLLSPELVRANLLVASLYLSAFEILKSSIVERIENFFTNYVNGQRQRDARYQDVKQLDKSELKASCLWLEQMGAITSSDTVMVDVIRQHRNKIAHELPEFLSNDSCNIDLEAFKDMLHLLRKIETWWIKEFELSINPDFDGVEVADEDIQPGSVLVLEHIIKLALDQA